MHNEIKLLQEIEEEAKKFGFFWNDVRTIIEQINSESQEIIEAIVQNESYERVEEEIGDLIQVVMCLCLYLDVNPQKSLEKANQKYHKRFNMLKNISKQQDIQNFQALSRDEKLKLWDKAKKLIIS